MADTSPQDEAAAQAIEHAIELYQQALLYAARSLPWDSKWWQDAAESELRCEAQALRDRRR